MKNLEKVSSALAFFVSFLGNAKKKM